MLINCDNLYTYKIHVVDKQLFNFLRFRGSWLGLTHWRHYIEKIHDVNTK